MSDVVCGAFDCWHVRLAHFEQPLLLAHRQCTSARSLVSDLRNIGAFLPWFCRSSLLAHLKQLLLQAGVSACLLQQLLARVRNVAHLQQQLCSSSMQQRYAVAACGHTCSHSDSTMQVVSHQQIAAAGPLPSPHGLPTEQYAMQIMKI